MANKKVSQLTSKPSVLTTDLFPIADPSTGQLFKTTISDLGTAIGSGVSSVNSLVGAVVLDTDDIQELVSPTNKWFTDTRARAALSASSPLTYNSGTGAFGIQVANGSQNGYLSSADWTTFNAKQAALSGTGFVKISGTTISYDNTTYLPLTGGTLSGALIALSGISTNSDAISAGTRMYNYKTTSGVTRWVTGIVTTESGSNSGSNWYLASYDDLGNFIRNSILINRDNGNFIIDGVFTATSIIKSGGTSSQFLKADGSVDSNTYLTTSSASSTYLPLAGGTMTGQIVLKEASSSTDYTKGLKFKDNPGTGSGDVSGLRLYVNGAENQVLELYVGNDENPSSTFDIINFSTGVGGIPNNDLVKINGNTIWNAGNLTPQTQLNGTGFIKASGTTITYDNSTYLTTSSAASTYLTLSGGTLNGTLSSNFSGTFSNLYSTGNSGIGTLSTQSITNGISLTIGDATTQHQPYLAFRRNSTGGYWAGINWYDQTTRKSFIEENSNFDLRFGTSNALALTITSTGSVGINTTSPSSILQIEQATPILTFNQNTSNSYQGIYFNGIGINYGRITNNQSTGLMTIQNGLNNGDGYAIRCITDGSERIRITPTGTLQVNNNSSNGVVGTNFKAYAVSSNSFFRLGNNTSNSLDIELTRSDSATMFSVNGHSGATYVATLGTGLVYSNSGVLTSTNPSDSRLKKDIKSINYGLKDILKLRPVTYNWKDDAINQGIQFGFIAQEVQEIMPDAIKEFGEETKFLGLEKDAIYATLVNAIKELKAELDGLKNK